MGIMNMFFFFHKCNHVCTCACACMYKWAGEYSMNAIHTHTHTRNVVQLRWFKWVFFHCVFVVVSAFKHMHMRVLVCTTCVCTLCALYERSRIFSTIPCFLSIIIIIYCVYRKEIKSVIFCYTHKHTPRKKERAIQREWASEIICMHLTLSFSCVYIFM